MPLKPPKELWEQLKLTHRAAGKRMQIISKEMNTKLKIHTNLRLISSRCHQTQYFQTAVDFPTKEQTQLGRNRLSMKKFSAL